MTLISYTVISYWYVLVFVTRYSVLIWRNKGFFDICCCCFLNYYSAIWHYPLKFYVGRLHVQHASWPAGGSKAPLLPPPNGAFVVIWKRVSLYVASPRSLEQGWQRSLGGLHKCIMNNWVGEARDCRWHSKAVICLDVSDCFYSLMGALPIKAQFTASHEVARIHPSSPRPFPPPALLNGGYFWMMRAKEWSRVPHYVTGSQLPSFNWAV